MNSYQINLVETQHVDKYVAYHEAGHAVVAHNLACLVLHIEARLFCNASCSIKLFTPTTDSEIIRNVAIFYAGWLAQRKFGHVGFGLVHSCADRHAICKMTSNSPNWKHLVVSGRKVALEIIERDDAVIHCLAEAIIDHGHLNRSQLAGFFRHGPRYVNSFIYRLKCNIGDRIKCGVKKRSPMPQHSHADLIEKLARRPELTNQLLAAILDAVEEEGKSKFRL